ncbi:hypothetical protein I4U23_019597 [Adineta vaga]|nr:hypothetical protein I4U23_019597 [Adineta vaga]
MLQPYFTDLSMTNISISDKNPANFRNIKSKIRTLGITNPNYKNLLKTILTNITDAMKNSAIDDVPYPDGERMILKANYQYSTNKNDRTASYLINVRQKDSIGKGRYVFDGVSSDIYSSVTCIYYDTSNTEIRRIDSKSKPAFCDVLDEDIPDIDKLEMRVYGIFSSPTDGDITFDGFYVPMKTTLRGITPYFLQNNMLNKYNNRDQLSRMIKQMLSKTIVY